MPRYYIKISGAAWDIQGNTPDEAINSIRKISEVYCNFRALEIGKDCDELGYEIRKTLTQELGLDKRSEL